MSLSRDFDDVEMIRCRGTRSHSAQGLAPAVSSPAMKIPLPPRMWITDIENESSDEASGSVNDEGVAHERPRVRSRFRHHKTKSNSVPIGIFWDIENCQISLIHVCGTQKNAADEKLRQCMRRFGELHTAPAALLLISGDITFAADLSDFRHRKNMESLSQSNDDEEEPTCEMEVVNLPFNQPTERIKIRLKRLADNCGGKVLQIVANKATLRFPTPDHAAR
ncbi:putative limkain b1 [Operophtera brumata]|uniref:Putative limkain b1 n=1 Tax=Operophtera brumata TaxID=104452 RepID=A0A0L7L603_OPEBR|nr:putative limkain b1 [Operophtera brumata]